MADTYERYLSGQISDCDGIDYEVWYRREPEFMPRQWGADVEDTIQKDYVHLITIRCQGSIETVYMVMQGEVWSPEGQARPLIKSKGLRHTSMSVGDLVKDIDTGIWYEVDHFGFKQVNTIK